MAMSNSISPKLPGRVRGRPFEKGQSGNPGGRQIGSRNKTTLAAASLLAGESEALTRKAVEMALAGDPTAMRLCIERVLPPCRERTVKFSLPPIEGVRTGETRRPSSHDVSLAMNAVTSALARGEITPREAETIAGVVDTFVRAIETTKKGGSRLNLMEILTAGDCDWDEDNSDAGDYGETGDYEGPDDCDYDEADPK
jgi:Family of unknown function (DUF5681)